MTEAQTLFFGGATGALLLLGVVIILKSALSKSEPEPEPAPKPRRRPF